MHRPCGHFFNPVPGSDTSISCRSVRRAEAFAENRHSTRLLRAVTQTCPLQPHLYYCSARPSQGGAALPSQMIRYCLIETFPRHFLLFYSPSWALHASPIMTKLEGFFMWR